MLFKNSVAPRWPLYFWRRVSIGFLTAILINFSRRAWVSLRCLSSHSGKSCAAFSISSCMALRSFISSFFSSSGNSSKTSGLRTSPFLTGATTRPTGICSSETLLPLAFFCSRRIYSSLRCLYFSLMMLNPALYSSLSTNAGRETEKSSISLSISLANSLAFEGGKLMAIGLWGSSKL